MVTKAFVGAAVIEIVLYLVILVYLSVSAFACSRIAAGKDRGSDEWFVCGLLFGLVAVIAIVLLPRLPDRPDDVQV